MKEINDEPITFETAKIADQKGFPRLKYGFEYTEDGNVADPMFAKTRYSIPTQSLLRKWLRDNFKINITIDPSYEYYNFIRLCIWNEHSGENEDIPLDGLEFKDYETFELALEDALIEALKLIKV